MGVSGVSCGLLPHLIVKISVNSWSHGRKHPKWASWCLLVSVGLSWWWVKKLSCRKNRHEQVTLVSLCCVCWKLTKVQSHATDLQGQPVPLPSNLSLVLSLCADVHRVTLGSAQKCWDCLTYYHVTLRDFLLTVKRSPVWLDFCCWINA